MTAKIKEAKKAPPHKLHKEALAHVSKKCKKLARVIKKVRFELDPETGVTPFAALSRSIAFQQLSGKAAETIFGRFKKIYKGKKFPTPEEVLKTPDEKMRAAGLSRAKVAAIKDLALKTTEGVVPSYKELKNLSDEEIIERLTTVKGIGRWSVEMFLIFRLGRMDIFSATDYGVRKGFAKIYGFKELPAPKMILAHAEIWKPYRTIATWYMWRSLEIEL